MTDIIRFVSAPCKSPGGNSYFWEGEELRDCVYIDGVAEPLHSPRRARATGS